MLGLCSLYVKATILYLVTHKCAFQMNWNLLFTPFRNEMARLEQVAK